MGDEFVQLSRAEVRRMPAAQKRAYRQAYVRQYARERAARLRERERTTEPRKCLKCGRNFPSLGPQNRVCDDCNRSNAGHSTRVCKVHDGR